jgi:D-alanyl-D-alanine carboxypeptidase/D-alanyl-D-alanine-endopeptidase (penicillin-binding protein 4)
VHALAGAIIAALALAGCGGSVHRPAPQTVAASVAPAIAPSHPVRQRPPTVSPALRRLRAALTRTLRHAGPATGAAVYDLTDPSELFARRAQTKRPPASVEKLFTTVALLTRLSPSTRLHTTILGTGRLGAGGVWHGNLYLRGGGDPTLGDGTFNRIWENGYGPTTSQLVHQLTARGIRRVTGKVIADESLFDSRRGGPATRFHPDVPDFGGQLTALAYDHGAAARGLSPATFAAKQLVLTMRATGMQATAATFTARTPVRARRLAIVSSPPLHLMLDLMNAPSDDLFAELLTKQLGVRFAHRGTIAAGARVISATIAGGYGLHPRIVDGSGLSRADGSSPAEVVALLKTIWQTPVGQVLSTSLPIVGVSGTTQRIATHTAAQGRCIAKTGTLDDVTNLAGYCHGRDGHVLTFAFLIDGPSNEQALALLSRMVAAVAEY